jgi:hypothetical protein
MKLSDPMRKALRYMLYVEMFGGMSQQTWHEFDRYNPKGRTLNALASRGLITGLVKDANGFVVEGGEHKLTRPGYIELAYNYFEKPEEGQYAIKRLNEINEATRAKMERNREIHAEAQEKARERHGVGYTVEQARAIEKELLRIEKIKTLEGGPRMQARRIKTQDEVREDRAQDGATLGEVDTIVGLLLSRVLGIPAEEVAQAMQEIKIVPIDPTILGIAQSQPEDPPFIRNLEALANGDPSAPDSTERSRRAMEIARQICAENGIDSRFLIHAHEFPSGVQICTRFVSFVAGVQPLCDMIACKIAEDFGWTEAKGGFSVDEDDHVAIVVAP